LPSFACDVLIGRSSAEADVHGKQRDSLLGVSKLTPKLVRENVILRDLTPTLCLVIYGVVKSGKPFDANFAMSWVAIQDGI